MEQGKWRLRLRQDDEEKNVETSGRAERDKTEVAQPGC